jgi:hypothetical protein
MKFYRMELYDEEGHSAGYTFVTNRAAVAAQRREWVEQHEEPTIKVEEIEVEPTKAGILAALNCYASHPDNG